MNRLILDTDGGVDELLRVLEELLDERRLRVAMQEQRDLARNRLAQRALVEPTL